MQSERDPSSVLITGGSSDIGLELAQILLDRGRSVGLVGRNLERLRQRASHLPQGRLGLFASDLRHFEDIESLARDALRRFPDLDGLVHLAGLWHDASTRYQGPRLWQTDGQRINDVLAVTLTAPLQLARLLVPWFLERECGRIVFMSCDFSGPAEAPGWVDYYVANLAVRDVVEGLAEELKATPVRVSAVAPSFVATEPLRRFYPDEVDAAVEPQDVARAIADLLFDQSAGGRIVSLPRRKD